jgi:hypothetical protein
VSHDHDDPLDGHALAMVRIHPLLMECTASMFAGPGTPQHERVMKSIAALADALHQEGPDVIGHVIGALVGHIGLDHYAMDLTEEQCYEIAEQRVGHYLLPEEPK